MNGTPSAHDHDVLVIGSVTALWLTEKGYRVGLQEPATVCRFGVRENLLGRAHVHLGMKPNS